MLRFLTAGESHGPELVVIIDGLPGGLTITDEMLAADMVRRQRGHGRGARNTKIEKDTAIVVSGMAGGQTTGAPLAMRIVNADYANQPATPKPLLTPRPGHADLAGGIKYGHADFKRVRERASARETAARVAAGAVARALLAQFGVRVGSFVTALGPVTDPRDLAVADAATLHAWADAAETDPVRSPDPVIGQAMVAAVDEAKVAGQTLGGEFIVFATGAPAGLGSHVQWDRKLDGLLAQAIVSIHAVKGVEIGEAFRIAHAPGTEAVDALIRDGGALGRPSNVAGGIEGGITNGEPVLVRAAMKPLSSVRAPLVSVDLTTGETADPPYVRSDVTAVPAAGVVGEAMVAWVLAAALVDRFGGDRLDAMQAAVAQVDSSPLGPSATILTTATPRGER